MNRILNFRVRQLCDTMESLHQRVRTMLASEIGLAVRDAVHDCLETARKKQPPPRVMVKTPPKIDPQLASPYLVASISTLLRKLGLRDTVTETPARSVSNTSWTICLSVIDLPDILGEVHVVEQQRKQAIAEFLANNTGIWNDTLDYVPLTHALQEKIIQALQKEPELKRIAKRYQAYVNRQAAIRIISKISGCSDDKEWNRFVARANST